MTQAESVTARRLREQAERALAAGQGRKVLEPLLERLVHAAAPGSESAVFAHRALAELRVQEHPWRALLHLRHVLEAHPSDDVAHAMAGLAHAISGHYRSSVAAYREAARCAPDNPWYQHNLGHLLDVALERPSRALPHLRTAHDSLGDNEPEVAASLASCLARLGARERAEAHAIVARARTAHPRHEGLAQLARALGPAPAPVAAVSPQAPRGPARRRRRLAAVVPLVRRAGAEASGEAARGRAPAAGERARARAGRSVGVLPDLPPEHGEEDDPEVEQ